MSDDLEDVAYASPGRQPAAPPGRRSRPRLNRPLAIALGAALVLIGLLLFLPSPSPPQVLLPEPKGGLLADLRGDDPLWQLRVKQAALEREMSFVRKRLSVPEGASPTAPDLARALAELEARHAEVAGLVGHLEASQMRLVSMAVACQAGLAHLSEAVERLRAEERN